eukprot:3040755-Pyramimonas_sp.AAC.1
MAVLAAHNALHFRNVAALAASKTSRTLAALAATLSSITCKALIWGRWWRRPIILDRCHWIVATRYSKPSNQVPGILETPAHLLELCEHLIVRGGVVS